MLHHHLYTEHGITPTPSQLAEIQKICKKIALAYNDDFMQVALTFELFSYFEVNFKEVMLQSELHEIILKANEK